MHRQSILLVFCCIRPWHYEPNIPILCHYIMHQKPASLTLHTVSFWQFALEDVASNFNATKLDQKKLIEAIQSHNPTILSLSFCYTNVFELNDILRSAGIYTVLIMSKDRSNITFGKYVVLDSIQRYSTFIKSPKNEIGSIVSLFKLFFTIFSQFSHDIEVSQILFINRFCDSFQGKFAAVVEKVIYTTATLVIKIGFFSPQPMEFVLASHKFYS